jgi:hypothetical protein
MAFLFISNPHHPRSSNLFLGKKKTKGNTLLIKPDDFSPQPPASIAIVTIAMTTIMIPNKSMVLDSTPFFEKAVIFITILNEQTYYIKL